MFSSFLQKTASFRLTQQEELELVKKYKETGDEKALKKLKISFRPLIRQVASKAKSSGNDITISQIAIRADGHLPGLFKKYDESQGQLNTYLTSQLQFLLKNAVSENQLGAHVPRPENDNLFAYQQAKNTAEIEFGHSPTPEQILTFAPKLKTVDEINRISQYNKKTLVGDAKFGNDEDDSVVAFKDLFNGGGYDPNDRMRSLQMDELRGLMNELNPQEKRIIEEYVFNEKSMANVSLALGLSSSQVRKTINNWKELVKNRGLGL